MAAPLAETRSFDLPIPSSGTKRPKKTLADLAPCFVPFGNEKVYAEGIVFELPAEKPGDTSVFTLVKKSPDQQRVTAINKIVVVREPMGDEVWIVPEQPGKDDRSKRFRYTGAGVEISLFNGSFLQVEYDLKTGERTYLNSFEHNQEAPQTLPVKELDMVVQTMDSLVSGRPLELTTMQSLVNFSRDQKLEGF